MFICETGSSETVALIQDLVTTLMKPTLGIDKAVAETDTGPDISQFGAVDSTMPQTTPMTMHDKYFYYHHAPSDVVTVFKPSELDYNAALLSILAYTVADMNVAVPRKTTI